MKHEQGTTVLRAEARNPGARRLTSIVAVGAVAVAISARVPAAEVHSQSTPSVDPAALATFVDSFMTARMAGDRIPGASFVFVQNGRVLVMRGYGLANGDDRRSIRRNL